MEDFLFYNSKRDKVDLTPFLGKYNIFILCKDGYMTIKAHQIYTPTLGGSLFVLPRTMPVTEIWFDGEADADILLVSDFLMNEYRPIVPWEPKCYKYLSYMSHVLNLEDALFDEKRVLEKDLDQIKEHLGDPYNYLDEEITGSLLRVFLCDFWRVFFRMIYNRDDRGLPSKYLAQFLLDVQKECKTQRDVSWYAEKLGITSKYLTEISKNATGYPASVWIDYYAARVIRKELLTQSVSFTDLAKEMNFTSLPVFTRYVKRVLGCSPSEGRDSKGKFEYSNVLGLMEWSDDDKYLEELPPSKDETE